METGILARLLTSVAVCAAQDIAGNSTISGFQDFVSPVDYPDCPQKGCLPCPANAIDWPNCTCAEGYEATSGGSSALATSDSTLFIGQELIWDQMLGWVGVCTAVNCGSPPLVAAAQPATGLPASFRFGETARFLCETGYLAEDSFANTLGTSVGGGLGIDTGSSDIDPRVLEFQCEADGSFGNSSETRRCVPVCGDGMLVSVAHLPRSHAQRENCDDGGRISGDGCSADCRVEPGFVCRGGSPSTPDRCERARLYASAALVLRVTGRRAPTLDELRSASRVALAAAVGCPERDVDIVDVSLLSEEVANFNSSRFHTNRISAKVDFRIMVSDPWALSIETVEGALHASGVLKPKLTLAFSERTSLGDLYVRVVDVLSVVIVGDRAFGLNEVFSLSGALQTYGVPLCPIVAYLFWIGAVVPWIWWAFFIRKREHRLMGRYTDISNQYKGSWAFNWCVWSEHKWITLATVICCLPARVADTWDAVGLHSYWTGVRKGVTCCACYMFGCCICGAVIPGQSRSELRDFFGFGDKVKGNLELSDYFCYLCCPVCAMVQEARHVDAALEILPPPMDRPHDLDQSWRANQGKEEDEDESEEGSPEQVVMA